MKTILHKFINSDDGYEVHVTDHPKGYAVTILDTDSGKHFPSIQIFPSELWAAGVAKSIAEGYEYNHAETVNSESSQDTIKKVRLLNTTTVACPTQCKTHLNLKEECSGCNGHKQILVFLEDVI